MTDKELLCQFPNKCEECGQYLTIDCDKCKYGLLGADMYPCEKCMHNPNLENHYNPK